LRTFVELDPSEKEIGTSKCQILFGEYRERLYFYRKITKKTFLQSPFKALALEYLHLKRIIFRDLKSSNLMIHSEWDSK